MKPESLPDAAEAEAARRDETLADHLEQHLAALTDGAAPSSSPPADAEWDGLRGTLEQVHALAQGLGSAVTVEYVPETRHPERKETGGPRSPSAPTPARIGKFEVVRPLGQGGQAMTLLAFDPDLKRHVVLKLYHAAHTGAAGETVLHEGQALARVRSPYVAPCYSAERHEGMPYLVMEYVRGPSLAQRLKDRPPLRVAESLEWIGHLAEGLAAVHACGLLHRDVKPANILLGEDGRPRLVDFGLALALGSEALRQLSGTLPYMAPEQARGEVERIDARTDVFGLGAVLYHLLTGRPPYLPGDGADFIEVVRAGRIVPVGERNPQLPRRVRDLCGRCLEPDPARRFASAADLAAAIRRLRRWRWLPAAAGLAAALPVVAVLFVLAQHSPPPVAPTPPSVAEDLRHPDGRPLRRDFSLKVEPQGGEWDAAKGLHVLKVGQIIRFRVEAPVDCYVALWDVADDEVTQLFPNDEDQDNRLKAGVPRLIPNEKVVKALEPSAVEYLHFVASVRPLRPPGGQKRGGFETFAGAAERDRMLGELRKLGTENPNDAVTETILRFQVRP
jgi:serine/threonine protein kinase